MYFRELISVLKRPVRVLDIGGTQAFWEIGGLAEDQGIHLTLLNLTKESSTRLNFVSMLGDGRDLSAFEDGSFDVVFSNSVIEHLGQHEDQRRMAREIQRVGKRYFIQTPNKSFPIEPHFLFPLINSSLFRSKHDC